MGKETRQGGALGWLVGAGLAVFALYALTGPGRIDIIDGQYRFDVAYNLMTGNGLAMDDPALRPFSALGVDGRRYASYAPGGSVLALPALVAARLFGDGPLTLMFGFSLTSALFGGLAAVAYGGLLRHHGVERRVILWSIGVVAVASPMWFMGTTTFHQLPLAAVLLWGLWLSFVAARRDRLWLAALAGLVGGFATFAQESEALLVAWLAVPFLFEKRPWPRRFALVAACGASALFWLAMLLWANELRFGSALNAAKLNSPTHPPLWGSFLQGFGILAWSRGKAFLLYAPSYLLGFAGAALAYRQVKALSLVSVGIFVTQFVFACNLSFCAGDWTWGPRYLMGIAPLVLLTVPWVLTRPRFRAVALGIVGVSLIVQVLSISVDHQRFFFERDLHPFFWYREPEVYFRESQLSSRVSEILSLRLESIPDTVRALRPGPYPGLVTYAPFGVPASRLSEYPIFELPRPWVIWTALVPARLRPVDPVLVGLSLVIVGLSGLYLMWRRTPGVTECAR